MDSLTFLERLPKAKVLPVYVLTGDEDFLKRRVLAALRKVILGEGEDSFGLSTHPGDKASFAAVHDELQTLPFLSQRRLVVIDQADPFVTRCRAALEKLVASPPATGTLVLDVKTWPATTKLAKMLDTAATLTCKAPPAAKLPDWCVQWMAQQHGKNLAAPASRLLVDLIGAEMGLLDQEIAKLAVYAGEGTKIDSGDVDKLVGNSRLESTWKIFDAIGAGKTGEALTILNRLFEQGDEALGILGAFSWQLRKLAQAFRLNQQGTPLGAALAEVGLPPYRARDLETQLRHLGRRRAGRLFDWLLETDLGLKGSSSLPPRTLLERFVVRLAVDRPLANS